MFRLSYRKDDRAMRLIHGCTENFPASLSTPTATFPELCNGLLFRSILKMCAQNLKFVALPVSEIIIMGYSKYLESPRMHPHSFFPKKILTGFCSHGACECIYLPNLNFVALPVREIIGGTQKIWAVPG